MSEYDFNIEGKPVRINSIQKHKDPDVWDTAIFVNESRVPLNAFNDYPPKHFSTEGEVLSMQSKPLDTPLIADHIRRSLKICYRRMRDYGAKQGFRQY
jgi:hypothetical protein